MSKPISDDDLDEVSQGVWIGEGSGHRVDELIEAYKELRDSSTSQAAAVWESNANEWRLEAEKYRRALEYIANSDPAAGPGVARRALGK